jgi:hypothetical protein
MSNTKFPRFVRGETIVAMACFGTAVVTGRTYEVISSTAKWVRFIDDHDMIVDYPADSFKIAELALV